jgi:hypothetical protein
MSSERTRSDRFDAGPAPYQDEFASTAPRREGRVDVIHGVYAHSLPLAGLTIRQARTELQERMNIPVDALAVVDGSEANEDTVLQEGQVLNFVKPAGEKGRTTHYPISGTKYETLFILGT